MFANGKFLKISRVLMFANSKFLKIFKVYEFQPQRKKNKKKTVESREIRLMFLSRSTERQVGHDGKSVVID